MSNQRPSLFGIVIQSVDGESGKSGGLFEAFGSFSTSGNVPPTLREAA